MSVQWSFSSLNQFENCPRHWWHLKIKKDVKEKENEHMLSGQRDHKSLELYVTQQKPLPDHLLKTKPVMDKVLATPGEKLVEQQVALDAKFQPTGWFDKNVWVRCVLDLGIKRDNRMVVLDHKFGKRKPDNDQLELFAAVSMHKWSDVDNVTTGFLWHSAGGKIDSARYTKEDVPRIWQNWMPRVIRLERALDEGKFPPKPSGLCGWCSCTKVQCEFAKER